MVMPTSKIIKKLKMFNTKISKDVFAKRLINIGLTNFYGDKKHNLQELIFYKVHLYF